MGLEIFNYRRFYGSEIVLHHKVINKTRSTEKQENSAHSFGDNYHKPSRKISARSD